MLQQIKPRVGKNSFQDAFAKFYELSGIVVKTITLNITQQCDLRCTYCYEVHKNSLKMSKEVGIRTIDMLFEEYAKNSEIINENNAKAVILEFIGGEPLLEIDLIDYLVDYFKYRAITENHTWAINYMISITTNGIHYCDSKVQRFIEKNKNNLSITITIDGNKELHDSCRLFPNGKGSYDIVEKSVKKQVSQFDEVATKLTLAPENISYLVSAYKNLISLGITVINANTVYESGWEIEHAKIFYQQLKELADYIIDNNLMYDIYCSLFEEYLGMPMSSDSEEDNRNYCGGNGLMMAIDYKGDIYPCLRYIPFTLQNDREPMIVGNVYDGLIKTEEQKKCVNCLRCITRKSQSTDECFNCPIARGCGWCSGYNYDQFGTADKRATYICIMHKARVLANCYYWGKLYQKESINKKFELHVPKNWALEIIDENEYEMLKDLAK